MRRGWPPVEQPARSAFAPVNRTGAEDYAVRATRSPGAVVTEMPRRGPEVWARDKQESTVWRWSPAVALGLVLVTLVPLAYRDVFALWMIAEAEGILYCLLEFARGRFRWGPLHVWHALPFAGASIAALQLLFGGTSSEYFTEGALHFWLGMVFLIPLVREAVSRGAQQPAVLRGGVIALALFLIACFATGMLGLLGWREDTGVPLWGPFVYRNHYAAFVILVLPVLLWQVRGHNLTTYVAASGSVAGIAGVVSSGSRAAAVLLAVTVVGFLIARIWRERSGGLRVAAGILALAAAGVAASSTLVWRYRLREAGDLFDGRLEYWTASLRMIAERPLTGWGFLTWPDVYRHFATIDTGQYVNRAHSDWLEWTAEGGILMAIALVLVLAWSVRHSLRYPWMLGVPVVLVYGMADYPLRLPLILFLILVLLSVASRLCSKSLALNRETAC